MVQSCGEKTMLGDHPRINLIWSMALFFMLLNFEMSMKAEKEIPSLQGRGGELVAVYCCSWFYNLRCVSLWHPVGQKSCVLRFLRDRRSDSPPEIFRPHETAQPKKRKTTPDWQKVTDGTTCRARHRYQDLFHTRDIGLFLFVGSKCQANDKDWLQMVLTVTASQTALLGTCNRGKVDDTCKKRTSNSKTWPARLGVTNSANSNVRSAVWREAERCRVKTTTLRQAKIVTSCTYQVPSLSQIFNSSSLTTWTCWWCGPESFSGTEQVTPTV